MLHYYSHNNMVVIISQEPDRTHARRLIKQTIIRIMVMIMVMIIIIISIISSSIHHGYY